MEIIIGSKWLNVDKEEVEVINVKKTNGILNKGYVEYRNLKNNKIFSREIDSFLFRHLINEGD